MEYGTKWWRFISRDYREARSRLSDLCKVDLPKGNVNQLKILKAIHTYQQLSPTIDDFSTSDSNLFGEKWSGLESDWDELEQISSWLADFHNQVNDGELPETTVDFLASSPNLSRS